MTLHLSSIKAQSTHQVGLIGRVRAWATFLGQAFGGNRDFYKIFGYKHVITHADLLFKYQRQDIATRVVEAEPRACWSSPPKAFTKDEEFFKQWQDLISKTELFHHIYRLDNMIGMNDFGVLLLGFDDEGQLSEPIVEGAAKNLTFVQPYSASSIDIQDFEDDETSELFAQPRTYKIRSTELSFGRRSAFKQLERVVHASRVIHVAENTLESPIFGNPRLIKVFNLLDDILKVAGGASEMYWLAGNKGLQADIDKDMQLDDTSAAELSDEIEEYQHQLRRFIRTRGVKITDLGGEVADPRGVFTTLTALISAASGIPQRILLGSEAGQLASSQDRANWAVRIEERRELFAEPVILNPLLRKLIFAGVLKQPSNMTWRWPDAFRQSPLERAQTNAQRARSLANVAKALSDSEAPVSKEEARAIIGMDEPESPLGNEDDVST